MKKLAATTPDELRALADVQPVAWMYEHDGCVDTPLFTVNHWTKCEEPWNESPLFLHPAPDAPQAEPHRNQPLRDLLAVIHCDGGHHTEAVGIEQSIKDALSAVCVLKGKLAQAEPKREPLSDSDADYWLRHRQAILDAIRRDGFVLMSNACGFWLKRMDKASEAHKIGGSDERD